MEPIVHIAGASALSPGGERAAERLEQLHGVAALAESLAGIAPRGWPADPVEFALAWGQAPAMMRHRHDALAEETAHAAEAGLTLLLGCETANSAIAERGRRAAAAALAQELRHSLAQLDQLIAVRG